MSGLLPNRQKSGIYLSGACAGFKQAVQSIMGFPLRSLPMNYLGIPVISSRLTYSDCIPLIGKITNRIQHWTARFLSYAGRLLLIKSIILSIQQYWSKLFLLPKKVIHKVEQLMRNFLQNGTDLNNGGAKVSWEDLACPKEEGGLGIPRLEDWNIALLGKQLWSLLQPSPSSSWAAWARANLLRGRSLWDIPIPATCSWSWRKILQLRPLLRPHIKHIIGDGRSTWLWLDNWLPFGPIQSLMGDRVIYDSGLSRNAKVCAIIHSNNWRWPVSNSPELLTLKASIPPQFHPDDSKDDAVLWTLSPSGTYTSKSAWNLVRARFPQVRWMQTVWFPENIPRTAFILWLAIRGRLNTQDRLHFPITHPFCLLCGNCLETHDHIFFACSASDSVWHSIQNYGGFSTPILPWKDLIEWVATNWRGNTLSVQIKKISLAASVYHLWMERNNRLHSNSYKRTSEISCSITWMVREHLSSLRGVKNSPANRQQRQIWNLPETIFLPKQIGLLQFVGTLVDPLIINSM